MVPSLRLGLRITSIISNSIFFDMVWWRELFTLPQDLVFLPIFFKEELCKMRVVHEDLLQDDCELFYFLFRKLEIHRVNNLMQEDVPKRSILQLNADTDYVFFSIAVCARVS